MFRAPRADVPSQPHLNSLEIIGETPEQKWVSVQRQFETVLQGVQPSEGFWSGLRYIFENDPEGPVMMGQYMTDLRSYLEEKDRKEWQGKELSEDKRKQIWRQAAEEWVEGLKMSV